MLSPPAFCHHQTLTCTVVLALLLMLSCPHFAASIRNYVIRTNLANPLVYAPAALSPADDAPADDDALSSPSLNAFPPVF